MVVAVQNIDSASLGKTDRNSRKYFDRRLAGAQIERESFISHWKELSENVRPRKGRFFTSDRNKGTRTSAHKAIINSAGTQALRAASAGLLAGVMSPTRPWFKLEPIDQGVIEDHATAVWLSDVEKLLFAIFNSSNLYNMAPTMLSELLLFGTGCMTHVDDFDDVARFYTHTVGSYMLGQNERFEITTVIREFQMTTEQLVLQFGLDNVSSLVKTQWDNADYSQWHDVAHIIEPNPNKIEGSALNTQLPFRSVYWEKGRNGHDEFSVLGVSGFHEFPAYCPRWDVTGEDIYGTDCPGMTALGDIKGLQIEERRKAQAIDKMTNPPLKGPASLRNVPISNLPGGVTFYDAEPQRDTLTPLYQVEPRINELMLDIEKVERRIKEAFFVDLFLAISDMEGIQPRNQLDIQSRNEERLLQLGPVLERIQSEFLAKMVERTFNQATRAGILPPPPPNLEGKELEVRFISSLAIAQKAVAVGGIERTAAFVGELAAINSAVLDKMDFDQAVDEYAKSVGTPPKMIVPDDIVAQIREQRQAQTQAAQNAEIGERMSRSVKNLADSNAEGANNVMKNLSDAAKEQAQQ